MGLCKSLILTILFALALCLCAAACWGGTSDKMNWNNNLLALEVQADKGQAVLTNVTSGKKLPISLRSPKLDFDAVQVEGGVLPKSVTSKQTKEGLRWVVAYPAIAAGSGKLKLTAWLQTYKGKLYVRKGYEFTVGGIDGKLPFREIEMDRIDLAGMDPTFRSRGDQSSPIICDSFFMGVEFPVSAAKLDFRTAILASRPGIFVKDGDSFKSRDVVYSVTEPGQAAKSFKAYVEDFRAQPAGIFFGYNNWWTTKIRQDNQMMLDLAGKVKANLYDKYGVAPDVFTLDLGWSDRESIWAIDMKSFPNGFADLKKLVNSMGTEMGFWVSPCSAYVEGLDNVWAAKAGYEVFDTGGRTVYNTCMAGEKYAAEFTKNAVDIVSKYNVKHIKFDAYAYRCPSTEHGHLPDEYSAEPTADKMCKLYEAVRKVQPDIRLNPLAVGSTASPWWMKYVNFTAGSHGDDYPSGRCPAPVFKDGYTSARDFYTLRSALDACMPMDTKEVFGIINQTGEPVFNDAVDVLMRGHQFITLYLHPEKTSPKDWKFVSQIIKYGRANKDILRNTTVIFPESWRQPGGGYKAGPFAMRDPYGYVHTDGKRALVYLRNPFMEEQTITVPLDETRGFTKGTWKWNAVSVFPYSRTYATGLSYGDKLTVKMRPYDSLLLELSNKTAKAPSSDAEPCLGATGVECNIEKAKSSDAKPEYGSNWTRYSVQPSHFGRAEVKCTVDVRHEVSKLMVLVETPEAFPDIAKVVATVNGKSVEPGVVNSKDNWAADSGSPAEHWTWHTIPLAAGKSDVKIEVTPTMSRSVVSVWLYGETTVKNPGSSPLPHPKPIDWESLPILLPTVMTEAVTGGNTEYDKIDGVFLDSLVPVSQKQGWGSLTKNTSITGRPLNIGGVMYKRGLGTHAVGEVVYDLNGKWSSLTGFAGPNTFDRGSVDMAVEVDGKKAWESGLMKQGDPAKKIVVDLNGAKTLKLIVGDGGNGTGNDTADWGDLVLLP